MENMQYAEELVREFLVFRGFTKTLQAFEAELGTDIGKGFQVDKLLDLIFSVYIPGFQADKLVGLLSFFKQLFSSSAPDTVLVATLSKLEVFFLTRLRIPALLKISSEKNNVSRLKKEIKQLNVKLTQLQALLEEKDTQISRSRSYAASTMDSSSRQSESSTLSAGVHEEHHLEMSEMRETVTPLHSMNDAELVQEESESSISKSGHEASSLSFYAGDGRAGGSSQVVYDSPYDENGRDTTGEEEFPEVKVDFQETFLGHTSPITRSRFSASGNNIASASVDGTVRIWTYDSSTSPSRNATIYCGAEIMSLDWECKSDRLVYEIISAHEMIQ
ncbi:hypothetical protein CRG98_028163 [Punica granatum]|uniref:Uncharacterized protein n=1 Tax=Punica granatum TaxID=22663 RepID=A0A2I0J5E5_PUNGR|nr:hypothetical protein CRG98_028163 [Punica granatum]